MKPCAFPIQGKCHFLTLSQVLSSGASLTVSWAARRGSSPSPWALGGWIQFWASWPLESPGQPLKTPDHMAALLSPGWSFPAPRKHYAHEEGWVALGTIFLHFWAFSTVFDSNRQNAPGPLLGAKCHRLLLPVGFATRRCLVNESQIHKSLSYHSLLPMSHMKYITVHKILWAQTLAHVRTLKHSVLRGQSSHSTTKINESYFESSYPWWLMKIFTKILQVVVNHNEINYHNVI